MMHGISRNKRRSPHACRSAVGIFICASNGIGPAQDLEDHAQSKEEGNEMSEETLDPPLPPIDARTEAVAERLFGLKWALRKDSTEIIHEEWQTAPEWIRDGYLRQAIEVLATADQAQTASAKASGYQDRMRVEYRELTARAGRLRDMLQRYADGTLDFEPVCPISLLSRQLDVMDEYALILRRRANIEHISLGYQRIDTAARDTR